MLERLRTSALATSPVLMAAILLAVYFVLSLPLDMMGHLGSDVGGKTATMEVLASEGTVDVGYWASDWDDDASLHPMWGTQQFGDQYVQATTLPMLYVALPLYELGGLRLALLVPMLGAVAAALAARSLARDLGPHDGSLAFWVTGLGSSAAIYGLSFWEHSLGLGLMAWGVVAVYRAIERRDWRWALCAGFCFGAAATMRQEALVFGFVAGVVLTVQLLRGRRLGVVAGAGSAMVLGTAVMLFANQLLERAVFEEASRTSRAVNTATSFGARFSSRIDDILLTTFLPNGTVTSFSIGLAIAIVAGLVVATVMALRGAEPKVPLMIVVVVYLSLVLNAVVNGQGFVPGLFAVGPAAVVGAVMGLSNERARPLAILALVALPLAWMAQPIGALAAQWGGRYLLLTGWLLIVLACALRGASVRPVVMSSLAIGMVMTLVGYQWTVERSRDVGSAVVALDELSDRVTVFRSPFLAREAGPIASQHRWVAARNEAAIDELSAWLQPSSEDSFDYVAVLEGDEPPTFDGFVIADQRSIPYLLSFELDVVTYERMAQG